MTLEPILRAKMEQYKKDYLFEDLNEDELFERFVNNHVLSQLQPGAFSSDYELLDKICIGGGNDLSIDGIGILLNGRFISSCEDIDDILYGNRKGEFEFVFIQSKNKSKFDLGEYTKFTSGVENFLENELTMPANSEVKKWHDIYKYVMSNDVIIKWNSNPSIRLYYIVAGTWEQSVHIIAQSDIVKKRLEEKRCFGEIETYYIDSKALVEIVNTNENNYTAVMNFVDSMPLPEVGQVDNSSVVLCSAQEVVNLLSTGEGLLRRNLFEDNVRDFQGETVINCEIRDTLEQNAERFILLNNGITIVCDEIKEGNRKISVSNPQIVNGCQTCNVLFNCTKAGIDISNAYVIVKIIGSNNADIINNIVKGTNRQNIVYEEAFEITKEFHKLLESFFATIQNGEFEKIYYERRSRQFDNDPLVKPYQKVGFRILIQSVVSLFLYEVEKGHRHESKLLNDFRNTLFAENQSFYPYYVAAFIYIQVERLFKSKQLVKALYPYKLHIMLIIKELLVGCSPDINQKKAIEKYCKDLLERIDNEEKIKKIANEACEKFVFIMNKWIEIKGEGYRYAIKDNVEFKEFMLDSIREKKDETSVSKNRGKIVNLSIDKHGMFFGFIRRTPRNIFFHESDNPQIALEYEYKDVSYDVETRKDGKEYAVNIKILN